MALLPQAVELAAGMGTYRDKRTGVRDHVVYCYDRLTGEKRSEQSKRADVCLEPVG